MLVTIQNCSFLLANGAPVPALMRFILHRPLPLVCVGSFRLCGTLGAGAVRGPGGTGAGGREGGGWEPGTREHIYIYIFVQYVISYPNLLYHIMFCYFLIRYIILYYMIFYSVLYIALYYVVLYHVHIYIYTYIYICVYTYNVYIHGLAMHSRTKRWTSPSIEITGRSKGGAV